MSIFDKTIWLWDLNVKEPKNKIYSEFSENGYYREKICENLIIGMNITVFKESDI